MSKKLGIIFMVIAAVSLCLGIAGISVAAVSLGLVAADIAEEQKVEDASTTQYVMYVGTNDKDTYLPVCTEEEAQAIIDEVCFKYFDGYTFQEARGSWVDELNNATHEYTIVCYFDGAKKEDVYKVADELLVALNQSTILIETNKIQMDYYTGE